jgi:hypothetical protein
VGSLSRTGRFLSTAIKPVCILVISLFWKKVSHALSLCAVVIANSTDDSADLFGPQTSGVLGLGYSTVAKPTDSWMGMWLEMHPNVSTIYIGVALNHFQDFGDDGGTMHIPLADTSAYIGNIATMPVQSFGGSANSTNSTATGAGVVPQTGSNDWAIQLDSITFQNNGFRVQSGAGDLAIIEPSFPDIIIPNNQSQPICMYPTFIYLFLL